MLAEAGFVEVLGSVPKVTVQWLRSTDGAAHEGGCQIGDRRYQGRVGEQVEMRADDATILAAGGFFTYVAELT